MDGEDFKLQSISSKIDFFKDLSQISEMIHKGDLGDTLNLIAEKAIKLTGAKYGEIWLLNKKLDKLTIGGIAGQKSAAMPPDLPINVKSKNSISKHVVFTGKSHLSNNVQTDKYYKKWYEDTRSELAVPLKYEDKVIGVLNVESTTENGFTNDHRRLLEAIAGQAAVVVQNARLIDRLEIIDSIGHDLTSGIRLKENEILELIYTNASRLINTENMYIALYDNVTNIIRFPLATEHGEQVEYPSRKADMEKRGKTENIIFTGHPILHQSKKDAEAWYSLNAYTEFVGAISPSWLGVPMLVGEKVIGVIAVYDLEREYVYDEQDEQVLSSMASQAAIAWRMQISIMMSTKSLNVVWKL